MSYTDTTSEGASLNEPSPERQEFSLKFLTTFFSRYPQSDDLFSGQSPACSSR